MAAIVGATHSHVTRWRPSGVAPGSGGYQAFAMNHVADYLWVLLLFFGGLGGLLGLMYYLERSPDAPPASGDDRP